MQRLDAIWGPKYTPTQQRMRRMSRVAQRLQSLLGSLPWRKLWTTTQFSAALLTSSALVFGMIHPAVSQTFDLVRLMKPGRYLVAFLNSAELRPSGGLLGSFAVVDFDGRQAEIAVETNIYKQDNKFLADHFIPLPKPFDQVWTGRSMSLVNANFEPDFAAAAQTILDYYEAEYGDRLDGVVGLTVLPVIDLMAMTGPIALPGHGVVLTAEHFLPTLHQKIQVDYFKESANRAVNEPKTIIADLVSELPNYVKKLPKKSIWQLVDKALKEKQLMLFFADDTRQAVVEANNWAGRLTSTDRDYLTVYNANLGGGKTSLEVEQELRLEQLSVTARRLTISRTHRGGYDEFTAGENRNYLTVAVPRGSRLVSVKRSGADIRGEVEVSEDAFTSFSFWLTTQPRSSQVATVDYEVPADLKPGIEIQKQPGTKPDQLMVIAGDELVFSGEFRYDLRLR